MMKFIQKAFTLKTDDDQTIGDKNKLNQPMLQLAKLEKNNLIAQEEISLQSNKSTTSSISSNSPTIEKQIENQSLQKQEISKIMSYMINNFLITNKRCTQQQNFENKLQDSQFYTKRQPNYSLESYLKRIQILTKCSDSVMVLGFIYFDKIVSQNVLDLTQINWFKLIFVAILTAIRYKSNNLEENSFYAKVGGLSLEKMHRAEIELLRLLKFNIKVEKEVFDKTLINCQNLYKKLFGEITDSNKCQMRGVSNLNKRMLKRQLSNLI